MDKTLHKLSVKQSIIAGGVIVCGLLAFWLMPEATAAPNSDTNERLVTIHDRGQEIGVITKAKTLRQVFSDAKIDLDKNDLVEPGLDKKLVGRNYQVNVYRARPLVIVDGNTRQLVMSAYQTPRQIAKHAGIALHDQDEAQVEMTDNMVLDGASAQMVIDRALAVNLVLYGQKSQVYTQALTVNEFIKDKKITLKPNDTLAISGQTEITDGITIEVWRNGKQTITEEQPVEFSTRKIQDANQATDYRNVNTPGANGTKLVTYEVEMRNGEEISRKEIQVVVTKQPTEQVETVGAKPSFSGDFSAALAKLRSCEGGYTSWNAAGPYYGAYQFDRRTWSSVSSAPYGSATPAEQDAAAHALYLRRGWQPWPNCGRNLPDTYR